VQSRTTSTARQYGQTNSNATRFVRDQLLPSGTADLRVGEFVTRAP
jgi:hypothetical protein